MPHPSSEQEPSPPPQRASSCLRPSLAVLFALTCAALFTACPSQSGTNNEPVAPPNLSVLDSKGVPLKADSILEGMATEAPGDLRIQSGLQIVNTGGPVAGPLRSGWRLPKNLIPLKKLSPTNLPPGGEFAYEVGYPFLDGQEGIETMSAGSKKPIALLCELEPGQGLPAEVPVEYFIRRVEDSTEVFRLRLRLRPQWLLGYEPEGFPPGPTKVERALVVRENEVRRDVDWIQNYKFINRSHAMLGTLTTYHYLKARRPADAPSPALPLVFTDPAMEPTNWPDANLPPGFTAVQAWNMGLFALQPGETSVDWKMEFNLGRGGYIPPGKHDIAVEIRSHDTIVHRSFYTIEVPEKLPFPNIELLGEDDRPLLPGARLKAVVDQRRKNEQPPRPDFPRDITVAVPVRVLADGVRTEDGLADAANDLTWMFLVGDRLHPPPKIAGVADVFGIEGLGYYVLVDNGNLAALSDGKPHPIDLEFPLDPALAQAKAGQPGRWIEPGIRAVRILAFPAKNRTTIVRQIIRGRKPDRDLLAFERDFVLEVQQPAPIELISAP